MHREVHGTHIHFVVVLLILLYRLSSKTYVNTQTANASLLFLIAPPGDSLLRGNPLTRSTFWQSQGFLPQPPSAALGHVCLHGTDLHAKVFSPLSIQCQ